MVSKEAEKLLIKMARIASNNLHAAGTVIFLMELMDFCCLTKKKVYLYLHILMKDV